MQHEEEVKLLEEVFLKDQRDKEIFSGTVRRKIAREQAERETKRILGYRF